MHARLNTLSNVTDVDAGVAVLSKATGDLSQMHGYQGLVVSGSREKGRVTVVSLWENLEDLQASDTAIAMTRQEAAEAFGGAVTVEVFEVIAAERGATTPAIGCPVLSRRARTDAEHLEAALAYNRDVTVPAVKAQPGFRSMLILLDRERGEAIVGVVFDDMGALAGTRQAVEPSADAGARSVGVEVDDPEVRELLFAHTP